jgi:SAM-dependent methyltransferase
MEKSGKKLSPGIPHIWSPLTGATNRLIDFCAGNFYGAQHRVFDLMLGVSTRGDVRGDGVFDAGTGNTYYRGCEWLSARRALKDLDPGRSDVFIDLGSGKGRALLIAGLLPYKRVVGVEMDEQLCRLARDNIDRARPRLRAGNVECVNANVLEWPIPDDASVIFMFNPFIGQTFYGVMERILASYDRNPRILHIVYEYPWEHDELLSTGRIIVNNVRSRTSPGRPRWWQQGNVTVTYRVVDSSDIGQLEWRKPHHVFRARRAVQRWRAPNGQNFRMVVPGSDEVYTKFLSNLSTSASALAELTYPFSATVPPQPRYGLPTESHHEVIRRSKAGRIIGSLGTPERCRDGLESRGYGRSLSTESETAPQLGGPVPAHL